MNIYYTAKEIEDLAAKGVQKLEIGPGVTLTDFARDTAHQFGIALVATGKPQAAPAQPTAPSGRNSDRYNKPAACKQALNALPAAYSPALSSADRSAASGDSTTVNRLIDLMSKITKRGG